MSAESSSELKFEIGHVLFVDIVGYSKLLLDEQKERLRQLTDIVLATPQVSESTNEQLVRLPTGDGMALVFRNSSEEPARCSLEIAKALKEHSAVPVRMGIHSGPVSEVVDLNGRTNIAGAGINMAQRVMDCGDAGHILLTKHVADDLEHYPRWQPDLHSLGECEVKHGHKVSLVNLYHDEIGNSAMPQKLRKAKAVRRTKLSAVSVIVLLILLLIAGGVYYRLRQIRPLTEKDTVLLADFANSTGDQVFDATLRQGLAVQLEQSPFLSLVSDSQITQTLSLMGRSIEIRLTPEIARELCQRIRSKAFIAGSMGYWVSSALKNKEIEGRFVELASNILKAEPTANQRNLREWATDIINNYSGVRLSKEASSDLINKTVIPSPLDARTTSIIPRLQPRAAELAQQVVQKAKEKGIIIKVISGLRTFEEQDALYAQGRTAPGPVVTNARGGQSIHNTGLAFDVGVFREDKFFDDRDSAYDAVGEIAKSLGLICGGDWSVPDRSHFETKDARDALPKH